ncbi:MAG: TonB-dependent receptor [Sphingomonadales bacterium]|nr:TonB-dependent receptor [Sphingomonadales bacterium]
MNFPDLSLIGRRSSDGDTVQDVAIQWQAEPVIDSNNKPGPLNLATGDNSALRINAAYESLNNHRDLFDGDQYSINPTFRAELGGKTTIDLSYEYLNHERFLDRGIPNDGNGGPARELRRITFGDAEDNFTTFEAHVLRGTVQHAFSDSLKANFTASYGDYDKAYSNFFPFNYNPATNVVGLDGYIDTTQRQNLVLSGNLIGEFETGGIGHTLILGGEFIDTANNNDRFNAVFASVVAENAIRPAGRPARRTDVEFFSAVRPLALRGGVATLANGTTTTVAFSGLNDDTEADLNVFSAYIQDEIKIADWLRVVLGARFDSFEITVLDNRNGTVLTRKDDKVSPRLGLILKPQDNLSIYGSYSETFLPRSGDQFADLGGGADALDPDTFSNLEAGVKWDIRPGVALTGAVFQIEQSSPQPSDENPDTLEVVESRIRGIEAQLQGQVTEGWFLSTGYTYLDGEQQNRAGATGLRVRELPEHRFSIWNNVQVTDQLGFGLGVTAQDESFADNGNTVTLPAYARVDMAAFYQVNDNLRLQVNVENLLDTNYWSMVSFNTRLNVGTPRTFRLALTADFLDAGAGRCDGDWLSRLDGLAAHLGRGGAGRPEWASQELRVPQSGPIQGLQGGTLRRRRRGVGECQAGELRVQGRSGQLHSQPPRCVSVCLQQPTRAGVPPSYLSTCRPRRSEERSFTPSATLCVVAICAKHIRLIRLPCRIRTSISRLLAVFWRR